MKESESLASSSPSRAWSETRNGRITVIVGVVGLFVLVFWLATKSRRMLTGSVALVVPQEKLSFAEVWEEHNFRWTIPITNTANEDVKILGFAKSCSCLSIEPPSLVVPARSTAEVLLILDLTNRNPGTGLGVWKFETLFTPFVSGREVGKGWRVTGTVKKAFAFSSSIVQFEPFYFIGKPIEPKVMNLTYQDGLTRVKVACDPDLAQAKEYPVAGLPNCVKVEIVPNKTLRPGHWRGQIVAKATTRDGKDLTSDPIPLLIHVLDEIQVLPEYLFLGILPEGTRGEGTLAFQSLSGEAFSVEGIMTSRKDIEITTIPRSSGAQLTLFRISHQVRDLGFQKCTVTFSIRTKKNRIIKLPVIVTWHGIERGKRL